MREVERVVEVLCGPVRDDGSAQRTGDLCNYVSKSGLCVSNRPADGTPSKATGGGPSSALPYLKKRGPSIRRITSIADSANTQDA